MALIDRVKNILLTPKTEWPAIAGEAATVQSIFVGYMMILAAIGPIALAIATGFLGHRFAILRYIIGLAITLLLALIVDALAPAFGGEKNFIQSLKLVAYSYTAAWIAGIFLLLPWIGGIIGLLALIYSFYTFYLGVPVLKKCTQEKAVGFMIVVVVCGIVLGYVLNRLVLSLVLGGMAEVGGFGMIDEPRAVLAAALVAGAAFAASPMQPGQWESTGVRRARRPRAADLDRQRLRHAEGNRRRQQVAAEARRQLPARERRDRGRKDDIRFCLSRRGRRPHRTRRVRDRGNALRRQARRHLAQRRRSRHDTAMMWTARRTGECKIAVEPGSIVAGSAWGCDWDELTHAVDLTDVTIFRMAPVGRGASPNLLAVLDRRIGVRRRHHRVREPEQPLAARLRPHVEIALELGQRAPIDLALELDHGFERHPVVVPAPGVEFRDARSRAA